MDRDGYFYIVDRIKEMANISGFKVYTGLIDDILFKHPAVSRLPPWACRILCAPAANELKCSSS